MKTKHVFPLKMIKGRRTQDDVNRRQSKTKTAVIIALNTIVNIVKITKNRNSVKLLSR